MNKTLAAIVEAVRHANEMGITGIQEARTPPAVSAAYKAVDEAGKLTAYAITDLQTPRGQRAEPMDVSVLSEIAEANGSKHVHTKFAKLFLDGVPTSSRSAVMLEPYIVDEKFPEATRGMLLIDPDTLVQDLVALDRAGFTVKIHTAGDGSVRIALDALEQVREINGDSDLRHQLAHAGYMSPDDLPPLRAVEYHRGSVPLSLVSAPHYPSPLLVQWASAPMNTGL